MAVGRSEETALGSARGRFLESLPRKAVELGGSIEQLSADPEAAAPHAEARRKLHAVFASALMFRSQTLAALAQQGITRLDAAMEASRPLSAEDLEVLSGLVNQIAEFRFEERESGQQPVSDVAPAPTGRRRSNTLTGLVPVGAPIATPSEMPGRWVARATTRAPEARRLTLQRVLHVLLVAPDAELRELCQLLSDDSLRVSAVSTVREALDHAPQSAPDAIVAVAELLADGELAGGLRGNPLTDFVPLVMIANSATQQALGRSRAQGVDEIVTRPLRLDLLLRVLGRATGTLVEPEAPLAGLREATVEEVATRLGEEIRRGLIDAAESGRDLKVPLGEGAEVLAAAWVAVARVRALFSERSGGRVRFSDRNLRAAPALLNLAPDAALEALEGESPLAGRRILVADDDSAVVLMFAGLLREEGAYVTEVTDGAEALRAARRERPDLVISDVIMPGLDGFALCRELKRDPLLADVPVILISWKEDLLARMRELSAGASGYLRKEAGAAQIVASVREVLEPRRRLEASLLGTAEVRGNLEGTGVVALLRSVRRARPDARVMLRDAWNLFECELRDGRLFQLTRTASDGSFVRNEPALPQLLGVSAARFSVSAAQGELKQALDGTLDEVLSRGARELGAQLDALSGAQLERVERVVFDEDAHAALLDHVPSLVREVMRCLAEGERPVDLWSRGVVERALLEAMLMDMARRGVLRAVLGAQREDLVALARARRSRLPPTELGSPHSMLPPAPVPVISVLPTDRSELPPVKLNPFEEEGPPSEVVVTSVLPPAPAVAASAAAAAAPAPSSASAPAPSSASAPAPSSASASARAVSAPASAPAAAAARVPASAFASAASAPTSGAPASAFASAPASAPASGEASAAAGAVLASGVAEPELTTSAAEPPRAQPPRASERTGRVPSDARELDRSAAEARSSRGTLWAWTGAFVALVAVGFLLDRARTQPLATPRVEAIGATPERAVRSPAPAPEELTQAQPAQAQASAPQPESPATEPAAPEGSAQPAARAQLVSGAEGGFEISEGIVDRSVQVAPDQALLMVEARPGADGSQLSLDGRALGPLPVKLGVSEGIHELAITRGDTVMYRFLAPRRGSTWLLREP